MTDLEIAMPLVSCRLGCEACGYEGLAFHPLGMRPDVRFECPRCGSRETERYIDHDPNEGKA